MKPGTKEPSIPDPFLRTLLVRLAMLLVLAGSVWLVGWSVNRLMLVNRQLKQKSSAVLAAADEVQRLERIWDPDQVSKTEARFKEAKQSLFAGQEECAGWLKKLPERTFTLGLEMVIQPSPVQSQGRAHQKLFLLSSTVDLQPAVGSQWVNFPYHRLVNFTDYLQKPQQRIDVLELAVFGGSNSVRQARAVVQLWFQEEKPLP